MFVLPPTTYIAPPKAALFLVKVDLLMFVVPLVYIAPPPVVAVFSTNSEPMIFINELPGEEIAPPIPCFPSADVKA